MSRGRGGVVTFNQVRVRGIHHPRQRAELGGAVRMKLSPKLFGRRPDFQGQIGQRQRDFFLDAAWLNTCRCFQPHFADAFHAYFL